MAGKFLNRAAGIALVMVTSTALSGCGGGSMFGFKKREFFELAENESAAREAVKVAF